MILNSIKDFDQNKFPVVIFGSGPAGLSLALELEKKNINSLIIEAGEEYYSANSQLFYNIDIAGTPLKDLKNSRLRQFGGTGAIWGGWCKPLSIMDLTKFGFDPGEITKYQNQTCEILEIKNTFRESFINDNFKQIEFQYSKVKFDKKYFDYVKKSKNISLILNTQVSHFIGKNKNIEKAVCISNGDFTEIKSREFVLCCGGIENSRILLWSRFKNKELFDKKLKIGKYWMTHYWVLGGVGFVDIKNFKYFMKNNFIDHNGTIHISTREKKSDEKLQVGLYLSTNDDQNFIKEIVKNILCIAPEYGKKISKLILNKKIKCGNIFMHIEEEAISSNRIILDQRNKDLHGIPLVKMEYKSSLNSKIIAKSELEKLANFFKQEDLGRIAMANELFNLEEFESLGDYHHLGGTRIGDDLEDSVIDKDFKVHNVSNLYILGSSNFRIGTYKNPTFAIIQFSLKLANDLKKKIS
jgi:hypothetical protein